MHTKSMGMNCEIETTATGRVHTAVLRVPFWDCSAWHRSFRLPVCLRTLQTEVSIYLTVKIASQVSRICAGISISIRFYLDIGMPESSR